MRSCCCAVLVALLCAGGAWAETLVGRVIGVLDGDTVEVLVKREAVRVRMDGIDAPEKKQAFGTKAKQALSGRVYGQSVRVVVKGKDRYERVLGVLLLEGGENVNEWMVEQGWAWHYKKYSRDGRLAELEEKAREGRVGLWADERPVAPWEFRKGAVEEK
jgi:micrococcal nuclease